MKDNKNISFEQLGKRIPFTVPEDYFEDFASKMELQIQNTLSNRHRMLRRTWMYSAAAFFGVIMLSSVAYYIYNEKQSVMADTYDFYVVSQIDEADLMAYYVSDDFK